MKVAKKLFIGGINDDDAAHLVDPKDYLGALNIRIVTSADGQVGTVMPIEGTTYKNDAKAATGNNTGPFILPSGTNQVIGAVEDSAKRRVIWFNWNSQNESAIYCYNYDDDLIYTVLKGSQLSYGSLQFQQNKFIHSAAIAYGILYWTDDYKHPRRINIDAGIKTNHSGYVTDEEPYVTPMAESVISVIRPQPMIPLTVNYNYSPTLKLISDGYQGAYRFGFRDKEYSTFSTFSKTSKTAPGQIPHYGTLTFSVSFDQKIPQDADTVELAVKYPGSKMFIQKKWNREADGQAFDDHNNGITQLSFEFYADSIGEAVSDSVAFKAYDSVPLLAKTLEITKDRLFFGNTITGYENPVKTPSNFIISGTTPAGATPVSGSRVFKSGSTYKIGLVFYDEYGRSGGVIAGPTITTPEKVVNLLSSVTWSLTSSPDVIPTWATHYSIVRTKSKKCSSFFQFISNGIQYVTKDTAGDFVFSTTPPSTTDIYGLAIRASSLYSMGYGYTFSEGDVANVFNGTTVNRLNVINQYSDFIIVEYSAGVTAADIVEIFSPLPAGAVEYYYEIGNRYHINAAGTSTRSFFTTSDTLDGDVYVRQKVVNSSQYFLEVMNMFDSNWQGWYTDAGRGMTELFGKIERKETNLCFSEPFNVGVNGMSTFNALDYGAVPSELDSIQKIINASKAESQGTVLLVIGENETASQYIGESQVFDNTGSSFLAKSSGVLGNVNILKGSFGTLHPESVFRWKTDVVFFDVTKGAVVKYSENGLFPISDNKLRKYWRKVAQDIKDVNYDPTYYNAYNPNTPLKVLGMVDPFHEEYLIYTPQCKQLTYDASLVDITESCETYSYTIPTGQNSVTLPITIDGSYAYTIDTFWRETTITYNGIQYEPGTYFVPVPWANSIVIHSDTQLTGEIKLCKCKRALYSMYDGLGGVVCYSAIADRWTSKYSFVPEWMSNVGNRLVSFKDGRIYIHNGLYNTFYNGFTGTEYESVISGIHSEEGNNVKVYYNVAIEGDKPDMIHFRTESPNLQSSNIISTEWSIKEGVKYAPILRDRLSPNVSGTYDEKMFKGDKIRGEVLKFMISLNPHGKQKQIKFINIGYDASRGQTV